MFEEQRRKIDAIDSEISSLLCERAKICKEIGNLKKTNKTEVADEAREKAVIKNVTENAGEYADFVAKVYETIFNNSRKLQKNG